MAAELQGFDALAEDVGCGVDVHTQMRLVLQMLRTVGLPFDSAWTKALMSLPRTANMADREEWTNALAATRPAWERMYLNGHAPRRAQATLLLLSC